MTIHRYDQFVNKLKESQNMPGLAELAKKHNKAEIYFHKDLDGVASALAMRQVLEEYGIKTIDAHTIQYGSDSYNVKKPKSLTDPDSIAVLVDFAHGKPIFSIHSDHHDLQAGVDDGTVTFFKKARSNAEFLTGEIKDLDKRFPDEELEMISMVDSADFVKHKVTPQMIHKYTLNKEEEGDLKQLALVTNKLLLAYKNKPRFLTKLVLESDLSFRSILNKILEIAETEGYAKPEEMEGNLHTYMNTMKTYKDLNYDEEYHIATQYGGGYMVKPGSYDRYTVFRNYPDSNFWIIVWPMGLLQASCNPFKEKVLKNINLGEIAKKLIAKHADKLRKIKISIDSIKQSNEVTKKHEKMTDDEINELIGFNASDLEALLGPYLNIRYKNPKTDVWSLHKFDLAVDKPYQNKAKELMNKKFKNLTREDRNFLSLIEVNLFDLLTAYSGGHPSITNIQGFQFLAWNQKACQEHFGTTNYTVVMKMFQEDFKTLLKNEIDDIIDDIDTGDIELKGVDAGEV